MNINKILLLLACSAILTINISAADRNNDSQEYYNPSQETRNKQLIAACKLGYLTMAKQILNKGADINANNNEPLRAACEGGNIEAVLFLLGKEGCNQTPELLTELLIGACERGNPQLAELLIVYGADANFKF